jgi:hydroxymethylpyrimidine pyrophosphatase-like HAD family hydrolase
VQHASSEVEEEQPVDCAAIEGSFSGRPTQNLLFIVKKGGCAAKFSDVDGRPAKGWQVDDVCSFVRELVLNIRELTFVVTDGFIDLFAARLSKGYRLMKQMQQVPFRDSWVLAFGDGLTYEAMFAVVNYGIKEGNSRTAARL